MIRVLGTAAICVGLAATSSANTAPDRPLHLANDWQVSIDANGKVAMLHDRGHLDAAVREPLERAIHGWTFEPGRVDGQPTPTETTLTLDVTFVPSADDKYTVRIDDARTGGTIDAKHSTAMPHMPRDAARPGLIARVVVKADYDTDGKGVSVETQPDQDINASKSLQTATVAAVRKWTVDPERVGGHGVAASLMVPVCYTVVWANSRSPEFACVWTPPGSRSKIDNGASYALAPTAKLKSDVIGHAL